MFAQSHRACHCPSDTRSQDSNLWGTPISVHATKQLLPQRVRQWWAELPQRRLLQDHSSFKTVLCHVWSGYQSLEPLDSLGNKLPGDWTPWVQPQRRIRVQCSLCGCSGPPRPSKSTFLTHGLPGTCPHHQCPHGGSWSQERTEVGTEWKQKPSRGARAGWARWPDRGPGGPKAQAVLPLPDRTRTRKPRDESACKPAGGAL